MLSVGHMMVIFLVALVVLGPEKLPQVARTLGKVMADFRRITGDFRSQIEDGMRDIERQTRLKEEAASASQTAAPPVPGVEPAAAPNSVGASDTAARAGSDTPYEAQVELAQEAATKLTHEDPAHEYPAPEGPIHEGLGGPIVLPPDEIASPDPEKHEGERYHST